MSKFFTKNLPIFLFSFIPIIFLWHPNWLGFLGVQPYWPLFWLLPWSMIHGPINGLIFGLFLGIILDSLTLDSNFLMFIPSVKNIFAEVFLTGFLAPFICSQLLKMFKFSRRKLHL